MVNAIEVSFDAAGKQVELMTLPKPVFDAVLTERKILRWMVVALMLVLAATVGTLSWVGGQPKTIVVAAQSK